MYISKIIIQNFRNFENTEVEFTEGINVIIGHNNAGKTNLLRAIGLIFDSNSSKKLTVEDFNKNIRIEEYFEVDDGANKLKRESPPSIKVSLVVTESTGENSGNEHIPDDNNTVYDWRIRTQSPYEAKLTYEFFLPEGREETHNYHKAVLNLIVKGQTSVDDYWRLIERKFIHKYIARIYCGDENLKNVAERENLNRFDFQFLDAIRDAERYLLTGRTTLLKDVLNYFLDDNVRTDVKLTDEQKQEEIEQRSREFEQRSTELINIVRERINTKPILTYSTDVGASLGGEPSFEGSIAEAELLSTLRLITKTQAGVALPVSHNGLGYKNLIFISILLAKMQMSASNYASQDDKKVYPMLLIEEPEAHLHPSMQFKLLKFLRQNLRDRKQVRQVFITTHSTHITAAVELDEIICLNVDESHSLHIAYPGKVFDSDNEQDQKSKAYIKRFLDATKSDMLFAKSVILVEGIAEQLLMSCFVNYIERSLEDNHIAVVNVNGRYFRHFLRLFDYDANDSLKRNAVNKKVACITDADPTRKARVSGSKYTKCYPYALDVEPAKYEYAALSSPLRELKNLYDGHSNIKICSVDNGRGKTFEYELAFENPGCKTILTEYLTKKQELEDLMNAYQRGETLVELLNISTTTSMNDEINASMWLEEDKKKALIASRYLISIENSEGKGVHALELEYKLRENLENDNRDNFRVPDYIRQAIVYVCR